ncbi:unnamed protein product [Linum tenue]|uniref:F-box domain-containing protein n=1 Tax=Linum tenue TaxID=586396 RepID=A0AAV0LHI7_9ROSI|nr:unnamed protein product [Linum tenue]
MARSGRESKADGDDRTSSGEPHHQLITTTVFPRDIIIEIFTRLPVKSLVRFRCVSKSFKTIISSPEFIKYHLRRLKSSTYSYPFLLIPSTSKLGYRSCPVESLYMNPQQLGFADLDHSPFLIEADRKPFWVVGSCDGLICVAIKRRFPALWNPSTRAFSVFPGFEIPEKKRRRYMVFGFGYDLESNDYKIVSISCYPNKDPKEIRGAGFSGSQGIVHVCSSKSRNWKRIEDFKYGLPYDYPGKYVKGTLNWLLDNESSSIVSLNLGTEQYEEVIQPEYQEDVTQKTIGVLEDCLCVMYHRHGDFSDLWVMNEFGSKESWTKLFRLECGRDGFQSLQYAMPLHVTRGRALLWLWSSLAVYNYEDASVVHLLSADVWCAQLYIESLVSPDEQDNH